MNHSARRRPEGGFTLIETLVALVILGLMGVAFLGATEAHVARITALEQRAAAQWAAENYLAERGLGVDAPATETLLGIDLVVTATDAPTPDPDLLRLDISAATAADGRVFARLTGFVRADATGPAE